MIVSNITVPDVADYLRLQEEDEYFFLQAILTAAKEYVKSYTGLNDDEIDLHEDITIAVFVLCQDMYDNRSAYVDKVNTNKTVDCILGMHSVNLL